MKVTIETAENLTTYEPIRKKTVKNSTSKKMKKNFKNERILKYQEVAIV